MILFSHLLWHVKPPLESTKVAGFFSLPRFRCPSGFTSQLLSPYCHLRLVKTWLILVVNKSSILIWAVTFRSSVLEIFCGQKNGMMFQRYVVWKVENYLSSASVKRQHSETYCRVDELWWQIIYVHDTCVPHLGCLRDKITLFRPFLKQNI